MRKQFITIIALVASAVTFSQVGIDTDAPKATLDVVGKPTEPTTLDGIIAPRLTGDQLRAKLYTTDQTGAFVYITAADTAPAGQTADVTSIGYYYFDGTKWIKSGQGTSVSTEPWFDQETNTEATENTQDIYQMGSVAIGKNAVQTGAALDVEGSVRLGTGHLGTVGANSVALGRRNTASALISIAMGDTNIASGYNSTAMGGYNTASGLGSTAMGRSNKASGFISTAMGHFTTASGDMSTAMGLGNIASSLYETVIGTQNAITTGNSAIFVPTDALFQIGNGPSPVYSNAITVLKNAHTAIGVTGTEENAKPTELLDLGGEATAGNGGLKIRNINSPAYTGNAATDKIVVADADGVLKTVEGLPSNDINIYKDNGTLTANRVVSQNNYSLTVEGSSQRTIFRNNAGTGITQDSGSGTRASIDLSNGGVPSLWIFTDTNSTAQINASGNSTSLSIGTNTANPAPLNFKTSNGSGEIGVQRAQIAADGRFNVNHMLSIGYTGQQSFSGTERLKVNGSIVTTGATYPDYVFQDYFDGSSKLNSDYKFTTIYEAEKFIKENNHLPGVTPIGALEKTENGYAINLTDLSVQLLEKIEELYLYTIEQQKQIDELTNLVKELQKR